MRWSIDPETSSLVSPPLARSFRILPLGRDDSGAVHLLTDQDLTEAQRGEKEQLLSFQFGKDVVLETLEKHPDVNKAAFARELDRQYGVPFPTMFSRPAIPHLLVALLVGPDSILRRKVAHELRAKGFDVVEASGVRIASAFLNGCCQDVGRILICGRLPGGPRAAAARLQKAAPDAVIEMIARAEEIEEGSAFERAIASRTSRTRIPGLQ